ncbi:MAG: helix-hairpin-helix domain-containing protein [Cytophagales bacterium]
MKNPVFSFIKDFFDFSQKEMNGFVVMIAIMLFVIVGTIVYDHFSVKEIGLNLKESQTLDSLVAHLETHKVVYKTYQKPSFEPYIKNENAVKLFHFNPNTISENDLISLGLKQYLAERIVKYRTKGGKFKVKADLKKMYGLPETKYAELEPFIDLPAIIAFENTKKEAKSDDFKSKYPQNYPEKSPKIFKKQDLNLADTIALEKVYGVGLKLASRIIKYREKLGGFLSFYQLKEVWGLDSTTIKEIEKKFLIEEGFQAEKINVNTDDFQLLKSHPYIGFTKAKLILNYRKMHGTYYGIDQLKQIQTISVEEIEKMKPYLEF